MSRIVNAYKYFLDLRASKYENRKFPLFEAILDTWYEFFSLTFMKP
jgi:hypothetical protein